MLWFPVIAHATKIEECVPNPFPTAFFVGDEGAHFGAALDGGLDVDGDGAEDLAVGSPELFTQLPALGRLTVICGTRRCLELDSPWYPAYVGQDVSLVPDLDADGRAEIFAGAPGYWDDEHRGAGWLVPGSGVGPVLIAVDTYDGGRDVGSGDFDGDGWLDLLLVADDGGWTVSGQGGLSFGEPVHVTSLELLQSAGDLDADGRDDLLAGARALEPGVAGWWLSGGTEPPLPISEPGLLADAYYYPIPIGDFDGDSLPDLMLSGIAGFGLFRGSPAGPVFVASYHGVQWTPQTPVVAVGVDWNGDGDEELFIDLGETSRVYDIDDAGLIEPPLATFALGCPIDSLAAADLDGDGLDEVAVGMSSIDLPDALEAGVVWIVSSTPPTELPPGLEELLEPPKSPIPGEGIDRKPYYAAPTGCGCTTGSGAGTFGWMLAMMAALRIRAR